MADLDGGLVGAALVASALAFPPPSLGYVRVTAASPADLFARVDRGDFNAAIVANPGASAALNAALTGGSSSSSSASAYKPSLAVTFAFDEGRGGTTLATLLRAHVAGLVGGASSGVAAVGLARLRAGNLTLASMDSTALLAPVGYVENNLHPVQFSGLQTFLGVSYLDSWVIELFVVNVMLSVVWTPLAGKVRRDHLLLYVAFHVVATSAALAFWPQVIVRGLGATVVTARVFFASWAWVWLCMSVFGGILAVVILGLGPSAGNLFSFIFLILNLVSSSGLLPHELMPPFFKIGLGLPMYQGPSGGRTIVLGSYDRLAENLGVLFAYVGLLLIALGVAAWRARAAVVAERRREGAVHVHDLPVGPNSKAAAAVEGEEEEEEEAALALGLGRGSGRGGSKRGGAGARRPAGKPGPGAFAAAAGGDLEAGGHHAYAGDQSRANGLELAPASGGRAQGCARPGGAGTAPGASAPVVTVGLAMLSS